MVYSPSPEDDCYLDSVIEWLIENRAHLLQPCGARFPASASGNKLGLHKDSGDILVAANVAEARSAFESQST